MYATSKSCSGASSFMSGWIVVLPVFAAASREHGKNAMGIDHVRAEVEPN
jgi:hypothetical protein